MTVLSQSVFEWSTLSQKAIRTRTHTHKYTHKQTHTPKYTHTLTIAIGDYCNALHFTLETNKDTHDAYAGYMNPMKLHRKCAPKSMRRNRN